VICVVVPEFGGLEHLPDYPANRVRHANGSVGIGAL
jgi:hypothetical protein